MPIRHNGSATHIRSMTVPQPPTASSTIDFRAYWLPRLAAGFFGFLVLLAGWPGLVPAPAFFVMLCFIAGLGFAATGAYYAGLRALHAARQSDQSVVSRVVSLSIRSIRVVTAIGLLVLAAPFAFVFPFAFDDPRNNPYVVLAALVAFAASFPLSFTLSAPHYRWARANRCQGLEFVYGCAPLGWSLFVALVVQQLR